MHISLNAKGVEPMISQKQALLFGIDMSLNKTSRRIFLTKNHSEKTVRISLHLLGQEVDTPALLGEVRSELKSATLSVFKRNYIMRFLIVILERTPTFLMGILLNL